MIARRTILLALGYLGLSRACSTSSQVSTSENSFYASGGGLPPHCEALSLVWRTQQEQIYALEIKHANPDAVDNWSFDVDERRWTVVRPVPPGGIDSTQLFNVTYVIGGAEMLTWSVDTRSTEISLLKDGSRNEQLV